MDEYRLVNLTGHRVTAISWDDQTRHIPSSGYLRVESSSDPGTVITVDGIRIPIIDIREKEVVGPDVEDGVLYIVSGIVAAKAQRTDFVVPSRVERNKNGTVVGARAFARIIIEKGGE
jgi:hypothetical protein